jgi:hypothetical protein
MTTAAEQYQMMTDIWPRWRAVAMSTTATPESATEQAIKALYKFYSMPEPSIEWLSRLHPLPVDDNPFTCFFRESLIYSVWHRLADPSWVCAQLGYDRREDVFRLPANKRAVFSQSRIVRERRRPPWLLQTTNMISQFDVDTLAIQELAGLLGPRDRQIKQLAKIVTDIVSGCFVALLFQRTCLLITKPQTVLLNDAQQLSAQRQPALAWDDPALKLYMANGEILTINQPPLTDNLQVNYQRLCHMAPRERVLHIEYMGWEQFYDLLKKLKSPQMTMLDKDDYGTLYRIWMVNQQFIVVRVKNRTPEPDGSYRRYVIPVDNRCRPLPDPNKPHDRHGAPQELTALNAVASTFGMRGKDYAAMLGAES